MGRAVGTDTRWLRGVVATAVLTVVATGTAACLPNGPGGDRPADAPVQRACGGPTTLTADRVAPARGALFGAVAGAVNGSSSALLSAQRDLEGVAGRCLDLVNVYYPWHADFSLVQERAALERGQVPMVSWFGTDTRLIASGALDAAIRSHAEALRELSRPVLLRWFYEMDGARHAGLAHSPADYVAAWRHMREVFATVGATNVEWVWCPNAFNFVGGVSQQFYPGDDQVDWTCADGYSRSSEAGSFAELFRPFYEWAAARPKPIMIGEFGVTGRDPELQRQWLAAAESELVTAMPQVRAVVYWHWVTDRGDYRFGSPQVGEQFRTWAHDPYFDQLRRARP